MIDYARKILDKQKLGSGDFADIRFVDTESLTVNIENGLTKEVSSKRLNGAAARALVNGAWGFATTAEITKTTLKQIVKEAITMAEVAAKKIKRPRKIDEDFATEGKARIKFDTDPKDISLEEKIGFAQDFEKNIREVDERIARSYSSYREKVQLEKIISSNGTNVTNELGAFRIYSTATSREGNLQQNVSKDVASSKGIQAIIDFNTTEHGVALGERAIKLLDAEKPPSGKMNLVMDPSLVGVFVHEAFGHACEADGIITNESILTGKLNKKVGVEEISITDDPTIEGLRGSFAYDSEGTKTRLRKLVTDGVLTEYYHTLETASMMDLEPNGAGRAQNYLHPPQARMGNTFVDEGDKELEELFEIIKDGIYLVNSYGGYVHPAKGQFMFSSQQGYVIEKGKQKALTQNVSMSGMVLEVLQNTIGVGKNWSPAFNGNCGKGGQWVPVSAGGPSLAVKDLVVGGR
jgi:TldD protein